MSTNRIFQPRLPEALEDRAVPSAAGLTVATGIPGISVTLPSQVSPTNPQVQAAFAAFDQSYIRAVDALLSATDSNGLIVSTSGRAVFTSAIEASLTNLAEQLVLSLNPGSTSSTTAGQVQDAIVGGGSTSLEAELLALSLAQLQLQVPNASTAAGASTATPVANVVTTAEQVRPTVRVPVAESAGDSVVVVPASTSNPGPASTRAGDAVRSAFGNFLNHYFQAVQGTLLAPGSDGQINPGANRAAFDAQVGLALQSLDTSLANTLGRYPATSGLGPQIQGAIEGDGASSLKGQLANLATPQGAQAAVVRNFTLGSTKAIAQALAALSGDVARLIRPAGQ